MYSMRKNKADFGVLFPLISVLQQRPRAAAIIKGSSAYPALRGGVGFYQTRSGVFVVAEILGLPVPADEKCSSPVFAFHIHSGAHCTGNNTDPFADAMAHYNPNDCAHPYHSGDLPPLFGNNGYAFSAFVTNRFTIDEIAGKTVILHADPDDFTTQPSGNAGAKIACGEIIPISAQQKF